MKLLAAFLFLPSLLAQPANSLPALQADLLASDPSWGNTEGPAVDSKGNLYFTSRGTFKGIVRWSPRSGAKRWLAVAAKEGPGGIYIDEQDNLFITATGEQQVLKISPKKTVSVVAENFDAMPGLSKGPNDLVVLRDGTIYMTEPNGYDGTAAKGTIYRIPKGGKAEVFSQEITGPNGIELSQDQKTLYVSHNTALNTTEIVSWPIDSRGKAGAMQVMAKIEPCQADGMDFDSEGNIWVTCYSHGDAYKVSKSGKLLERIHTQQQALTNCVFGRGKDKNTLYLTSSDMARVTGYVYRAKLKTGGTR